MSRFAMVAKALFAIVTVSTLAFGVSQAMASTALDDCSGPGVLGTCPPYDAQSCYLDCLAEFPYTGGLNNGCRGGCCVCAY